MTGDPSSPVAQIEHIALATSDLESSRNFYLQLGAMPLPPWTLLGARPRSCVLDFGGVRLELFEQPGSRQGAATGAHSPRLLHLGFVLESADAVDDLSRVLAAAGHRVIQPPHRVGELGRYESIVLDPDGNRVKLTV